jgi:molecular chaperone HtpG
VRWESDGGGTFSVDPGTRATRGTDVTLHLRSECIEFADAARLKEIVTKHSDFVQYPVNLAGERANQASAPWAKSPSELDADAYKAFYKHACEDWRDPLAWTHVRSEGTLEFSAILYLPAHRPFDLDHPDVKRGLRLYQQRVLVLEHAEQLLPRYLRFVRGVVDAPELQLNVSREILQVTPTLATVKKQLVKRVLRRLEELHREDVPSYTAFWNEFGVTLKEGLAEDRENADKLAPLLRFRTSDGGDDWRDLASIKSAMKDGQDAIYYVTGLDLERLRHSPHLERFKKKGWEVLLLSDPVDEWVVMNLSEFQGTPLKSAARGEVEPPADDPIAEEAKKHAEPFATWMAELLKEKVAGVRPTSRLAESPSVLVDADWGVSGNMERILRAARQDVPRATRTLEVNPEHPLVKRLVALHEGGHLADAEPLARLLLDHAQLTEGTLDDAVGFAQRLQALMVRAAGEIAPVPK